MSHRTLSLSVRQIWPVGGSLLDNEIGIPALYGGRAELRGRADSSGPHFCAGWLLHLKPGCRIRRHFRNEPQAVTRESSVHNCAFGKFGADHKGGISLPRTRAQVAAVILRNKPPLIRFHVGQDTKAESRTDVSGCDRWVCCFRETQVRHSPDNLRRDALNFSGTCTRFRGLQSL